MDSVVLGGVEDPLQGTEISDQLQNQTLKGRRKYVEKPLEFLNVGPVEKKNYLCVDPELIQEVKLDVNNKDGRRDKKSQGQVEDLRRGETSTHLLEKQHQLPGKYVISLFYLIS